MIYIKGQPEITSHFVRKLIVTPNPLSVGFSVEKIW